MTAVPSPLSCSHKGILRDLSEEGKQSLEHRRKVRKEIQWTLRPYPTMTPTTPLSLGEDVVVSEEKRIYTVQELIHDMKSLRALEDTTDIAHWKRGDATVFRFGVRESISSLELPVNPVERMKVLKQYVMFYQVSEGGEKYYVLYPQSQIKEVYLGNDRVFDGVTNREEFSRSLASDLRNHQEENNPFLSHVQIEFLKAQSLNLKGSTPAKTISNIYQYIIGRVQYESTMGAYFQGFESVMPDIPKKNYGGLTTGFYQEGVCQGIARCFLYMLSFAGVHDVHLVSGLVPSDQQIFWRNFFGKNTWTSDGSWFLPWKLWKGIIPINRGDVPFFWKDAWSHEDKKHMAHAWNRIGLRHYDATFDLGNTEKPEWFGVDYVHVRETGREW